MLVSLFHFISVMPDRDLLRSSAPASDGVPTPGGSGAREPPRADKAQGAAEGRGCHTPKISNFGM
jgi:hypothetical protein